MAFLRGRCSGRCTLVGEVRWRYLLRAGAEVALVPLCSRFSVSTVTIASLAHWGAEPLLAGRARERPVDVDVVYMQKRLPEGSLSFVLVVA